MTRNEEFEIVKKKLRVAMKNSKKPSILCSNGFLGNEELVYNGEYYSIYRYEVTGLHDSFRIFSYMVTGNLSSVEEFEILEIEEEYKKERNIEEIIKYAIKFIENKFLWCDGDDNYSPVEVYEEITEEEARELLRIMRSYKER